jgi:2-polyprenyl-3-methyl-5-hydroxy-6-metoxy-1,4-benzoquinol methylase
MSDPAEPPSPPQPNPQLFFETVNAFQRAAAVESAVELNLFTAVARGHDTPAALAAACNVAERGARILADSLVVFGFMTKTAGRYRLTADSATFLDQSSPAYLGGAVEFLRSRTLRGAFDRLTAAVRAGGAPPDDNTTAPDHDAWVQFARGMAGIMSGPAEALARRVLAGHELAPLRVLDVAAGHGLFGIAVARHNPAATIVASDWTNVLAVAKDHARRAGVLDRYETLPGSAFDVDWGDGYDVVLLTNFLHHFDAGTNTRLLRRVHAALKPGGRAVALEFVPNDDRVTPARTAPFALTMLATTPAGDAHTYSEYKQMFESAGFTRSECSDLEPTMQQVVVGYR